LPLLVFLISNNKILSHLVALPTHNSHDDRDRDSEASSEQHAYNSVFRIMAVVTVSAALALSTYTIPTTAALGMSSVIFAATGLILLERAGRDTGEDSEDGTYVSVSANGPQAAASPINGPSRQQHLTVLRDLAAVLALACGVASFFLESSILRAVSPHPMEPKYGRNWRSAYESTNLRLFFGTTFIKVLTNAFTYINVSCGRSFEDIIVMLYIGLILCRLFGMEL
jgi:hypothetical protein